MPYELGFIGAGNMAEAIARAAITQNVLDAGQMIAADPAPTRTEVLARLGIALAPDNRQVIAQCRHVLLAVKPQTLAAIAADQAQLNTDQQIVISIMAGVRCAKIEQAVGRPARVVRVMPNTPLQIGLGMAGIAPGPHARPGDQALAVQLFGSAGKAVLVPEDLIDAITAVSGSGPAYLFYLAEAMERAASELGLAEHARLLVRQTLLGAVHLLNDSPDTAAELRRKVTSPGGTTEAAVRHLDAQHVTEAFVDAIKAAATRSRELA